MDWKEFLKPTWKKVILTIFLILFGIFGSSFIPLSIELPGRSVPVSFVILFWPSFIFNPCSRNEYMFPFCEIVGIGYFIAPVIYLYLLSCFIIWIYNKVKKK
jgi:hypothetical protein